MWSGTSSRIFSGDLIVRPTVEHVRGGPGLGCFCRLCLLFRVYADSCGLKTAFLGNGGRNAATIFSLRYSSSR